MSDPIDINHEQRPPAIKYGWLRALLAVIAFIVVSLVAQVVGVILAVLIDDLDTTMLLENPGQLLSELSLISLNLFQLLNLLGMLLIVWLFRRLIDRQSFGSLGFSFARFKDDGLQGLLWGAGLIALGFIILRFSGMLDVLSVQINFPDLILYFILFTMVSLNEEILIRGYVLTNFMASMHKYLALVFSSLIFAVMHLANANINLLSTINIFLAGILLGIYYIHVRNLWFPIGLHLTWNYFQGPVFGFEVSGVETTGMVQQELSGPDLWTGGPFGFEGSLLATVIMVLAIIIIHLQFRKTNDARI